MNNIKTEDFSFPQNCKVIRNSFSNYNPELDFSEEKNLFYLTEDLLQIEIESLNLIIDLGWYGEISSNRGEFKIFVIENQDWENPNIIESSKSQITIKEKLEKIIKKLLK